MIFKIFWSLSDIRSHCHFPFSSCNDSSMKLSFRLRINERSRRTGK